MPRPGPRRPLVALKLSQEVIDHIDTLAMSEGLVKNDGKPNRSEIIRLMLAYAAATMPTGWRPETVPSKD